jgi:DNA-binding NarL/FixJ family response regulator
MGYRIAIVEDDKLILDLITDFLKSTKKFRQIDTYNEGVEFLNAIEATQDNLQAILLDYKLGDTNAEIILKELQEKSIQVPVIILTSHYNQYLMGYMIRAGAGAYLPKNIKPQDLISVIEQVIEKGHYISPDQFPFLKIAFVEDTPNPTKQIMDINERDIEIIYLLANQKTAKEIADKLCVSQKTIEGYKNTLFAKTSTKSVVGLVLFAIQNNIINPEAIDLGKEA